jgi:solute carrier family 25 (mitochondrial aspartate/glutamate transporter), member 12/13
MFGGTAGVIGQSCVYPMYSVKTRMHTDPARYRSASHCITKVLQHEGWRGLYRGMPPALLGVFPEKAIKLSINDYLRARLSPGDGRPLPMHRSMLAGAGAGLCQVVATNPMEMVMITMQTRSLQGRKSKSMAKVIRSLGLAGLYRGTPATLARDIPFSMIFFSLKASLEAAFADDAGKTPFSRVFLAGILSGSAAATLSTPRDVVKTRLMAGAGRRAEAEPAAARLFAAPGRDGGAAAARPQMTMLSVARQIWLEEGVRGFFNGVVPRTLIISPLFGITLLFYEVQVRWGEREADARRAAAATGRP